MQRRTLLLGALGAVAATGAGGGAVALHRHDATSRPASGATSSPTPTTAVPVALTALGLPQPFSLGVLTSIGSSLGQGSDWKDAANGAMVAATRFALGGSTVTVRGADDHGSAPGAVAAMNALLQQKTAGIVVASTGSHLGDAMDIARRAGVPVLFPYLGADAWLTDNAWSIGPTSTQRDRALQAALTGARLSHTLVIDAGDGAPLGVRHDGVLPFPAGADPTSFAGSLQRWLQQHPRTDSVLVCGPSTQLGAVVAMLQGARMNLPIALTCESQSPGFAQAVAAAGGSPAGSFLTAGPDTGDAVASRPDSQGDAMTAFLSALRMHTEDASATSVLGDLSFRKVAASADTASHDAVVSLVRAAAAARSTDPSRICSRLATLRLGPGDGVAGPALDFTQGAALPDNAMVTLQSSSQDLGLRPATGDDTATPIVWLRRPDA